MKSQRFRVMSLVWFLLILSTVSRGEPERESEVERFGLGSFHSARFTPDGKRILVVAPGKLIFYPADAIEGESEVVPIEGGAISGVAYSPDGSLLAIGFEDGSVQVRAADSLDLETRIEEAVHEDAGILAFSPDNRRLVVGHDPASLNVAWDNAVFDPKTAERLYTIPEIRAADYLFSPDGSVLVSGDQMTRVVFREAATGKETASVTLNEKPFQGSVNLRFNADGTILYASENKAGVFALDPAKPALTSPFTTDFRVNGHYELALSPDEKTLYVRSATGVVRFDTETGAATGVLKVYGRYMLPYRFDLRPDGTRLIARIWGETDQQRLELWDVQSQECLQVNERSTGTTTRIELGPGGRELLASHLGGNVNLWDLGAEGPRLRESYVKTYLAHFSKVEGKLVVGARRPGPGPAVAHRTREGGKDSFLRNPRFERRVLWQYGAGGLASRCMAYCSASDHVAVARGRKVAWYSVSDGSLAKELKAKERADLLEFTPDGSLLAVLGRKTLAIYSTATGEIARSLTPDSLRPVFAFDASGKRFAIASAGRSPQIGVHATDEEAPVRILKVGSPPTAVAFGRGGKTLAWSEEDTLRLCDLETGKLREPVPVGVRVFALAFAPDDMFLIGGTGQGQVIRVALTD